MRVIRKPEVCEMVGGWHPAHLMRKARDPNDDFPAPVKLGAQSVGFIESEITEWIERRMAERAT